MKLLIDTNIFLEVVLEQEKAEEARRLLSKTEEHEFFLSDYSLHSIGLLLFRRKQDEVFRQFLTDMILNAGMRLMTLSIQGIVDVIDTAQRFNLDFDDAYQYVVAKKISWRSSASTLTLIGQREGARHQTVFQAKPAGLIVSFPLSRMHICSFRR